VNNAYPDATYPVAVVAELIGVPARAAVLLALIDGRARTAGELALIANVSAQSASGHLSKLLDGGLLTVQSSGRHRYYRLAGAEVAHAIEVLSLIAMRPLDATARGAACRGGARVGATAVDAAGGRARAVAEIYVARSCYDHLAGRVAVEMASVLEQRKVIRACGEREYAVSREGRRWFATLGVDVEQLQGMRRSFARRCLDWTERRPHLAGALGAALFSRMLELGWVARRRESRVVRITHSGERELGNRFGVAGLR
jgi:DNA-binding transcriptional ArsR family regulator